MTVVRFCIPCFYVMVQKCVIDKHELGGQF